METKAPCLKIPHSNHKHLKLLAELNIFVFSKRKGVPNKCTVDNNKTFVLPSIHKLPTSAAAVAAHENEGGHVTFLEVFRVDLLETTSSRNCIMITSKPFIPPLMVSSIVW